MYIQKIKLFNKKSLLGIITHSIINCVKFFIILRGRASL